MTKPSAWKIVGILFLLYAATAIAGQAQTFTSLFSFDGTDGGGPIGGLAQSTAGSLYGMTYLYGPNAGGTVFKVSLNGSLMTVHAFGDADGGWPQARLILATDGNFYGTLRFGGASRFGSVFKITPGGALTTLYSFCSKSGCTDGEYPYAPLIQGVDGNFYGTTHDGGNSCPPSVSCGTVFKITPTGRLSTLHTFNGAYGGGPEGGLVQGTNGNFYGTTYGGGAHGCGMVFKITPRGTFTTLHNFDCTDGGGGPASALIQAADGNFYGTTFTGSGNSSDGTFFRITPGGALTTLYSFCSKSGCTDGASPTGLVLATDGNFYGTTVNGGANGGTVFAITPSGSLTTLYTFCSQNGCTDGQSPDGEFMQDTNGNFYGTTLMGGTSPNCEFGCGTIFSLSIGLDPFVTFVHAAGKVGQTGGILGQGFTGTTSVSLNGIAASFTVKSDTFLEAMVPAGATTGYVTVTTPSGTLTSNVPFHVLR